jgi:PAS domain S-box-containing protein
MRAVAKADSVAAAAAVPSGAAAANNAFLLTPSADSKKYRIPLAIVLLALLVFLAVVPFARMRLPHAWAIMPSYESALVVNSLITAVLLLAQFAILRSRALLALASGYLFAALVIIPYTLTFPDVLAPDGLLGGGPRSTAWLYLFWHAGLPLAVIAYALLERGKGTKPLAQALVGPAVVVAVTGVAATACALMLLATAGQETLPATLPASLPTLVRNNGYTPAMLAAGAAVAVSGLAALAALWMRRQRSALDPWLMAVMWVWVLDMALSTLLNGAVFDLGFYAGRVYALVAASILLPVLLLEGGGMHAQPDRPPGTDRGETEQQPDAVAARADEPGSGRASSGLGDVRAQEIFRLAVDACPGGVVVIDSGGKIAVVNAEAEHMFGYRSHELIGRPVAMLVPERLRPQYVRFLQQLDIQSDARRIALRRDLFGLRKDGSEFPVEVGFNPLRTREGPMVLAVVVDISERMQMERLKDEFVSTVSHELRTPLTSIAASLGLLSGAAQFDLPPTAKRLIAIAHSNSERLVRLINDILDIEKIESGNLTFDLKRVDAAALVAQTIEANRALADECGVRLRLEASGRHEVRADPDRLTQVVTNLLSNAIKFSPRAAEVDVSIASRNDRVRISVRDHGPGIPESFRPHVFEKFAQAGATAARADEPSSGECPARASKELPRWPLASLASAAGSKGGSGLGLSIVKQIVLRHEGEVGFLDAPGGGTIFYAELPGLGSAGHRDVGRQDRFNGARISHDADDLARNSIDARAGHSPETGSSARDRMRPAGARAAFARTGTA